MDVKKTLNLFREFLVAGWPTVVAYEEQYSEGDCNDFRINWLQANWEQTVEQSLLFTPHFLQFYGEGADFGGVSSRVYYPEALATHHIICRPKEGGVLLTPVAKNKRSKTTSGYNQVVFESFVRITEEGWYEEAPDFDCVLADYQDTQIIFKFEDTEFSLEKM